MTSISPSSSTGPRISTVRFTTILGTPVTLCSRTRSGNSVATIAVAVTRSLSNAARCARLTARGHDAQVGVTNTRTSRGPGSAASRARLAGERPESPLDTIRIVSTSVMNS